MSDRRKEVSFTILDDRHAILVEVMYPTWKGIAWNGYSLHGRLVEHLPPLNGDPPEIGRLVVDVCDSRLPSIYTPLKEADRFNRKTLEKLAKSAPETPEYAGLINRITARYRWMMLSTTTTTTTKED